jgi:hypothetical protein
MPDTARKDFALAAHLADQAGMVFTDQSLATVSKLVLLARAYQARDLGYGIMAERMEKKAHAVQERGMSC